MPKAGGPASLGTTQLIFQFPHFEMGQSHDMLLSVSRNSTEGKIKKNEYIFLNKGSNIINALRVPRFNQYVCFFPNRGCFGYKIFAE